MKRSTNDCSVFGNVLYLLMGVLVAAVGLSLCVSAALQPTVVQVLGFLLLAPAGGLMAAGVCRLWEPVCRSAGLPCPTTPAPLNQAISLTPLVRLVRESAARFVRWTRRPLLTPECGLRLVVSPRSEAERTSEGN